MKHKRTFGAQARLIALIVIFMSAVLPAAAQFGLPKIKIPKPTPEMPKTPDGGGGSSSSGGMIAGRRAGGDKRLPGQPDYTATTPTFDASTFLVRAWTLISDYSRGTEGLPQRWAPVPAFTVYGPLESGSVISVAYTMPNGAAWFSHDCASTSKIAPGQALEVECQRDSVKEDKVTTQTGLFGFTVTVRNELSGTSSQLFKGTFRIASWVNNPTNQAKFSKNFVYYPKLDWKLQTALISTKPPKDQYDTNGPLKVMMWFRGSNKDTFENAIVGHLFYNGKEVAATNGAGSNMVQDRLTDSVFEESANDIHGRLMTFNAHVYDKENGTFWFGLYKNPGEYEIKVLQNGKLARSVKFTVAADGTIVDNGIAAKFGSPAIYVPATIIGDQDGVVDKNAPATDGFFGIPVQ